MSGAKLFMIPTLLGAGDPKEEFGSAFLQELKTIEYFIVESEKNGRRFLAQIGLKERIGQVEWAVLSEHTPPEDYGFLLEPLFEGKNTGILSDAGCPGIADPGAALVSIAHHRGIEVIPLTGPSSIVLALMGSGLNGQSFTFHGYLPVAANKRIKALNELEKMSRIHGRTQIFIEAPYRNTSVLADLLKTLHPDTRLCIACNLTQADQILRTRTIGEWRRSKVAIDKKPTVFLFLA